VVLPLERSYGSEGVFAGILSGMLGVYALHDMGIVNLHIKPTFLGASPNIDNIISWNINATKNAGSTAHGSTRM